ncbi:PHP-like protein [Thermogemmatispora aurantia]|uniref:PHP-like protein n=2 Tax=Thermogemmatispora TaxID=768669 RepID=A0A5J4KAN0_9CHLR|nr:PHP domain-containing protein [Thermogemmatispora aurantia]GER83711.1 PHP-like protein [Thermogemmatispora aurantia]
MQQRLSEQATIDLHLHTTWSDGRWTAADLLVHVRERGFKLIAVTDHDRVDTIPQLQDLAKEQGVAVLNGVEISAAWRGQMADVLGYGFDPEQPELRRLVEQVHEGQRANAEEVYAELLRRGYSFPERERLLAAQGNQLRVAGDCGLLLLKHGYVSSWREALALIRDAGYREIKVDLAAAIDVLHRSGGLALIAHPGRGLREPAEFTFYSPELLDRVRAEVAFDGLEVYYPTHGPELEAIYEAYVRRHGLVMSAGSDSHGPPGRLPIGYPAWRCRALLERLGIAVEPEAAAADS